MFKLSLSAWVVGTCALGNIQITEMTGLRDRLLAQVFLQEGLSCALGLAGRRAEDIPFKLVVGVSTKGTEPLTRRNLGAEIVSRVAGYWAQTVDEVLPTARIGRPHTYKRFVKPSTSDEAEHNLKVDSVRDELASRKILYEELGYELRVNVGLELFLIPTEGSRPLREHLVLVKTFPHEMFAGVLIDELSRELKLNSRQDILVLHPDLNLPHGKRPKLVMGGVVNGNKGTHSIAYALGMWTDELSFWRRQPSHYPFPIIRFGLGEPPPGTAGVDRRSATREREINSYLDSPAEEKWVEIEILSAIDLIQEWLIAGYYQRTLPIGAKNGFLDPNRYFGVAGPHLFGRR